MEDALDKLNEEFFQLTAQALELQKVDKPKQIPAVEGNTFVVRPSDEHLSFWSIHRLPWGQSPSERKVVARIASSDQSVQEKEIFTITILEIEGAELKDHGGSEKYSVALPNIQY